MTKKDLIKKLQVFDDDCVIKVSNDDPQSDLGDFDIESVTIVVKPGQQYVRLE